jgi:hypothetical protein
VGDESIVSIALELDPDVEPITGRIRLRHGSEVEFAGVVELLGLLDDARHAASSGAPDPDR